MSRGENEELSSSTRVSTSGADVAAELAPLAPAGDACSSSSFPDFTDADTPLELRAMWTDADSSDVPVRGAQYAFDQLKVPAGPSVATLLHFDLWTTQSPEARHHITRFDLERPGAASVVRFCEQTHPDALVFVLNIEMPDANNVSLVSYWLVPKYQVEADEAAESETATFYRLLRRFVDCDDDAFRDARFKLIPSFTQAPWVLNQLVQSRPALTGKKLTQRYFRGANYVEVAMDVSSSTVAHYIGSLCQSWASYIEIDVFVTVQGEQEDELPERILGGVRIQYIDLALAQRVDGQVPKSEEDEDEEDE